MNPIERLLDNHFKLDQRYAELENLTPILFAAKYGLTSYIESKCSHLKKNDLSKLLDLTNSGGLTGLHLTALYGHFDTAKYLLRAGASPLISSALGFLPIHMLFNDKLDEDIMENLFYLFVEVQSTITAKTKQNDTVAHFAGAKGLTRVLIHIKPRAPELFETYDNQFMTPLLQAVLNNQKEAAIWLLNNTNRTLTNGLGQNALHIAVQYSTLEMLLSILPYFDLSEKDDEQNTALDLAILNGDKDKIFALKSKPD